MAQTSISIKSTELNGGKVANKSITFVNNNANNADLAEFGEALCDLTTNNYVETNRVDKSNCDTEQGGGGGDTGLLDPQLTLTVNEEVSGNLNILFNGSGRVFIAGASTADTFNEEVTATIEGGVYCDIGDFREGCNTHAAVYLESDGTYAAAFATYGF